MEIPVIGRMSDFDAGIVSLAATTASPISSLVGFSFFRWGALILAVIYAFGSVARRIKILFLQRHRSAKSKLCPSVESWTNSEFDDDDIVSSDGDDEDEAEDSRASCSSEDERDENLGGFFEDFRVAGRKRKFSIRRRRSPTGENFAELFGGKGVVKLWDGLGLDVDFGGSISVLDMDRSVMIGSIIWQNPVVSPSSPRVVVAARGGGDGKVGVRSWDMRLRRRTPAVAAEWRLGRRPATAVAVTAAGGKVYVRDGVTGKVTIGDMRKANSPLVDVTEYDGDRWFDTDAVSETEEE